MKATPAPQFSNDESFGLFMEAIRELQLYEEEADKSTSDPKVLNTHLEQALEALEMCHKYYADDLLPRYFLGIALTMQNQIRYAEMLRAQQPATIPQAAQQEKVRIGPLKDQPWRILDRALDCFDVRQDGYAALPELRDAALLNSANVLMRIGNEQDYTDALEFLDEIKPAEKPSEPAWYDPVTTFLASAFGPPDRTDERKAFRLTVDILATAATYMRDLRLASKNPAPNVEKSDKALEKCGKDAKAIRDSVARHDVEADALTKRGMIKYFAAVHPKNPASFNDGLLNEAKEHLTEALQHKHNWIPAQTYLAQVYQALGDFTNAAEQLDLILGKAAPPAPPQSVAVPPRSATVAPLSATAPTAPSERATR